MKKWKSVLAIVLIFLLGMVAGGLLMAKWTQRHPRPWLTAGPPTVAREVIILRLSRKLELDATQREQVGEIVRESQQEMRVLFRQVRPQAQEILSRSESRIREVLRPDQREKYDRLLAERRARWRP